MNRGSKMPWLPRADSDYWEKIVTQISVDHFEKAVCEDHRFARQFESYMPKLREAGNAFARDLTALCEETQWLTLTHGKALRATMYIMFRKNHILLILGLPDMLYSTLTL